MAALKYISGLVLPLILIFGCSSSKKSVLEDQPTGNKISPEQITESDADYCFVQKDYPCAIYLYTKLIREFPDSAVYYYKRAKTYLKTEKPSKAIIDFNKAIEFSDSDNYNYYVDRGLMFYKVQNYLEAETDFRQSVLINDSCAICYNFLGMTHSNLFEGEQAIVDFKKAIKLDPDDPVYYLNLGNEYIKQNNINNAIDILNSGILTDSSFFALYFIKGIAYFEIGELNKGDRNILQSLKLNQKAIDFAFEQANQYIVANNLSVAEHILELVNKIYPNHAEVFAERGRIYYYKRDYNRSIEMYSRALELNPDNFDWLMQKAKLELQEQLYENAMEDLTQLINAQPENSELYIKRGFAWVKLNQSENARTDWEKALELNDDKAREYLDTYLK